MRIDDFRSETQQKDGNEDGGEASIAKATH